MTMLELQLTVQIFPATIAESDPEQSDPNRIVFPLSFWNWRNRLAPIASKAAFIQTPPIPPAAVTTRTPYRTVPYRTAPLHTTPHRTTPLHTAPHRTAPHRITPHQATPHHTHIHALPHSTPWTITAHAKMPTIDQQSGRMTVGLEVRPSKWELEWNVLE